jgi:hypothetical protein
MLPPLSSPCRHIFPLPVLGTVSSRPEPSGGFGWHAAPPHPCPSTHTRADTVHTACPVPTADMRAIISDLRWQTVSGHLLGLTLAHALDRPTRGDRVTAVLTPRLSHSIRIDRTHATRRPRLASPDDCRCEGIRCLRRGALRTSGALLNPLGLGALRALLPLRQPPFGTAHLPAHHRHRLTRSGALKRLLTTSLQGTRRPWRLPLRLCSFSMTLCSRCHGITPQGRLGPSSGLGRLRAWLTRCASSLRWAGGFRWR